MITLILFGPGIKQWVTKPSFQRTEEMFPSLLRMHTSIPLRILMEKMQHGRLADRIAYRKKSNDKYWQRLVVVTFPS